MSSVSPTDRSRIDRIGPDEYAERLEALGLRLLPCRGGYRAQCPFPERHVHGDRTPSLSISEGHTHELALKCFGCHATFEELLAAVGVERSKRHQVVVN